VTFTSPIAATSAGTQFQGIPLRESDRRLYALQELARRTDQNPQPAAPHPPCANFRSNDSTIQRFNASTLQRFNASTLPSGFHEMIEACRFTFS
jgi:hypothetical protein